jgi:predicted DNA-binding transcriptional regulator AlpA
MHGIQNRPIDRKEEKEAGGINLGGQKPASQPANRSTVYTDDEHLNGASAALFLALSERTLERWRRDRTGPSFIRMSARAIRYRLSDLRAWRDGRTVVCDDGRDA